MELKAVILLFVAVITVAKADDIDFKMRRNNVRKILREMVNQTNADSLNLPANSSSIRENITDTFSCENRTYGYYADVDNDCQIFHICLPTQTSSGRNVTYRWSFICPAETVFNQEVLVCTWERESIPCEESPEHYDKNLEFGKVDETNNRKADKRRKTNKRKDNLVVETMLKEAIDKIGTINAVDENYHVISDVKVDDGIVDDIVEVDDLVKDDEMDDDDDERLFTERSFKSDKFRRIGFRFKADVI